MTPGQVPTAYQLKITLSDSVPDIWRRMVVPAQVTLAELHSIIQQVMGWDDLHDYGFHQGMGLNKSPFKPAQTLSTVLSAAGDQPIYYLYDFQGGWLHRLEQEALEVTTDQGKTATLPICLDGAEACPPENIGGVWGYEELMERLDDPTDPEYIELIEKYGDFDPGAFDVDGVNARLHLLLTQNV